MKKFQDYVMIVVGLVLLVVGLVSLKVVEEPQGFMMTMPYICVGLGCGLFGGGMGNWLGKKALQNHPELRKQKEIEEKDERNRILASQAKARAYDMMVFVFGALMLSFALMDIELRAILLLVVAYLSVIGCGVYYRCRLDKEM